jgi:hypothetical protein
MNGNHIVFGALLAAGGALNASAAEHYMVSAQLGHDGSVFASPKLLVESGSTVRMKQTGDDGYALTLMATDAGDGMIQIETTLDCKYGSVRPTVKTQSGQTTRISIDGVQIELLATRVTI